MHVEFDQMPDTARVWVYLADRKLTDEEILLVEKVMADFINKWAAHGQPLKASFSIRYNQFILLSVDEDSAKASGCSIDASVHAIKTLEEHLQVSLTNGGNVAFKVGDEIIVHPFNKIKSKVESGEINESSLLFDSTIKIHADIDKNWVTSASNSWIGRFFN